MGSSPRVRGRHPSCDYRTGAAGLIPASAGQTTLRRVRCRYRGTHPRECGADRRATLGCRWLRGSSPRVRGRRPAPGVPPVSEGLIPASAGQTGRLGAQLLDPVGSSPRVRGRREFSVSRNAGQGLIPASAGQTKICRIMGGFLSAHPRECGADRPFPRGTHQRQGSSPRVRGRPSEWNDQFQDLGLIPASAGQTQPSRATPCTATAHPRECGADA